MQNVKKSMGKPEPEQQQTIIMKKRYTSEQYLKALQTRKRIVEHLRHEAIEKIMAAAVAVKQIETRLNYIGLDNTLTAEEKRELQLSYESQQKLIDVGARFSASITDEMLAKSRKSTKAKK